MRDIDKRSVVSDKSEAPLSEFRRSSRGRSSRVGSDA